MKITRAKVYELEIPMTGYDTIKRAGVEWKGLVSVILKIETDEGIDGWGEVAYYPGDHLQISAALTQTLPRLIGMDPTDLGRINQLLDSACPYVSHSRSTVDIACWDILGKVCKQPIYKLLGGKQQESVPITYCIWGGTPEKQKKTCLRGKAEGYRIFQCKIGNNPEENERCVRVLEQPLDKSDTLMLDANRAMSVHQAHRTFELLKDVDFIAEQPCVTVNACHQVCQQRGRALKLDESITDVHSIIESYQTKVGDIITLKLGQLGGLTKIKQMIDLGVSLDRSMEIECRAGLEIVTAAVAHVVISTPPRNVFSSYHLKSYHEISIATGLPAPQHGRMTCPEGPGLGITVDETKLGTPVAVVTK